MNPLALLCGLGLATLGVVAGVTPDVTRAPAAPTRVVFEEPVSKSATLLTRAQAEARIRTEVITPLAKRSLEIRSFSRARLPSRSRHTYRLRPSKAPVTGSIAFELLRVSTRSPKAKPHVVARGRVHRETGVVELRLQSDKVRRWLPARDAVKRLVVR